MQKIRNFFIASSGASSEILDQCPSLEQIKFASIGASVLSVSGVAAFSSYCVLQQALNSQPIAVCGGLLWGLLIYIIERFFLATYRVTGVLKDTLFIMLRLIMALFISTLSVAPFEVILFKDEIIKYVAVNSPGISASHLSFFEKATVLLSISAGHNTYIWWTRVTIYFMFILIQIFPLLTLILTPKGTYELLIQKIIDKSLQSFDMNFEYKKRQATITKLRKEIIKIQQTKLLFDTGGDNNNNIDKIRKESNDSKFTFIIHLLTGTFIFASLGSIAVGMHSARTYFDIINQNKFLTNIMMYSEVLVVTLDFLLFLVFIFNSVRTFLKSEWRTHERGVQ